VSVAEQKNIELCLYAQALTIDAHLLTQVRFCLIVRLNLRFATVWLT